MGRQSGGPGFAVNGLIEEGKQQWHTVPHESVRTNINATRTPQATSAIDTDAVGDDRVRGGGDAAAIAD